MKKIVKYLVPAVVVAGIWGVVSLGKCKNGANSAKAPEEASNKVAVRVLPLAQRHLEDRLLVQGTLEAKNYALVPARVGGTIEVLWADEGDAVKKGDKLAQTDSVKLEQAVAVSQRDLEVAQFSQLERAAALEQSRAQFEKAEIDYNRYQKLLAEEVVTQDEFERRESTWKQQKAVCDHAQALLDLAQAQEKQAAVALQMAEKDLQDSFVVAPIDGVVSARLLELGEMAAPGAPVFKVIDCTELEAAGFVPAEFYGRMRQGKTKIRLLANGSSLGEFPLSYKSPAVNERLRTFEIKALMKEVGDAVAPGTMVNMQTVLSAADAFAVPRAAVLQRNGSEIIFVVRNGQAVEVPVETGLQMDGWIEVKAGQLKQGDMIVTQGQTMLNDQDAVDVQADQRES